MPEYWVLSRGRSGQSEKFIGQTPNTDGSHELKVTRQFRPTINQRFTHVDGGRELVVMLHSPQIPGLEVPHPVEIDSEGNGSVMLNTRQSLHLVLAEPVDTVSRRVLSQS